MYPDLLSTYGDRGNLLVLGYRARKRGMPVELIEVRSTEALPTTADIYLIGGGEDGPQAVAAQRLIADGGLHRAVVPSSVVFAVCAGYQLLGSSFIAKDTKCAGLELLDVHSDRGPSRAVGERPATSTRASACRRSAVSRTTAAAPTWVLGCRPWHGSPAVSATTGSPRGLGGAR